MTNDIYLTTSAELTSIADKIRSKTGESATMTYPSGFISEIDKLSMGGGESNPSVIKIIRGYNYVLQLTPPIVVDVTIN